MCHKHGTPSHSYRYYLLTAPLFVLLQVLICINLVLWNWPNFVLSTTVRTFVITCSVSFKLLIHTFNSVLPLAPTIEVCETQVLECQLYTTLVANNLAKLLLAKSFAFNILNLRHIDTLTDLINVFGDLILAITTLSIIASERERSTSA